MTEKNPYLAEVFPEPPLVAFRRQKNVKDYLIRSKVPIKHNRESQRDKRGMKKCGKECPACPFINVGREIKQEKFTWKINTAANCETTNIVYLIQCNKEGCKEQYIGETSRSPKDRLVEHRDYVKSIFPTQATGQHFNKSGHTLSNMTITILEKVAKFEEA